MLPHLFLKTVSTVLSVILFITFAVPPQSVQAQLSFPPAALPVPGVMVDVSEGYTPALLKGLTVDRLNPYAFDFLIDAGDSELAPEALQSEAGKMIKYFLASLAIPEQEMWVNLSPAEKDRIIPQAFGQTEMGRDLLAQDYILKQLTATLISPENENGKKLWEKIYQKAAEQGMTDIPTETFNKVWIVPQTGYFYEHDNSVFITDAKLKVMLEEDYLSQMNNVGAHGRVSLRDDVRSVIREIILPVIEDEVNTGKNFANLRQIYNAMLLSLWFKTRLKDHLLGKAYADHQDVNGIALNDPQVIKKIWDQYVEAFRTGVYSAIREEYDPATSQIVPRTYFSGGAVAPTDIQMGDSAMMVLSGIRHPFRVSTNFNGAKADAAMMPSDPRWGKNQTVQETVFKGVFFKIIVPLLLGILVIFVLRTPTPEQKQRDVERKAAQQKEQSIAAERAYTQKKNAHEALRRENSWAKRLPKVSRVPAEGQEEFTIGISTDENYGSGEMNVFPDGDLNPAEYYKVFDQFVMEDWLAELPADLTGHVQKLWKGLRKELVAKSQKDRINWSIIILRLQSEKTSDGRTKFTMTAYLENAYSTEYLKNPAADVQDDKVFSMASVQGYADRAMMAGQNAMEDVIHLISDVWWLPKRLGDGWEDEFRRYFTGQEADWRVWVAQLRRAKANRKAKNLIVYEILNVLNDARMGETLDVRMKQGKKYYTDESGNVDFNKLLTGMDAVDQIAELQATAELVARHIQVNVPMAIRRMARTVLNNKHLTVKEAALERIVGSVQVLLDKNPRTRVSQEDINRIADIFRVQTFPTGRDGFETQLVHNLAKEKSLDKTLLFGPEDFETLIIKIKLGKSAPGKSIAQVYEQWDSYFKKLANQNVDETFDSLRSSLKLSTEIVGYFQDLYNFELLEQLEDSPAAWIRHEIRKKMSAGQWTAESLRRKFPNHFDQIKEDAVEGGLINPDAEPLSLEAWAEKYKTKSGQLARVIPYTVEDLQEIFLDRNAEDIRDVISKNKLTFMRSKANAAMMADPKKSNAKKPSDDDKKKIWIILGFFVFVGFLIRQGSIALQDWTKEIEEQNLAKENELAEKKRKEEADFQKEEAERKKAERKRLNEEKKRIKEENFYKFQEEVTYQLKNSLYLQLDTLKNFVGPQDKGPRWARFKEILNLREGANLANGKIQWEYLMEYMVEYYVPRQITLKNFSKKKPESQVKEFYAFWEKQVGDPAMMAVMDLLVERVRAVGGVDLNTAAADIQIFKSANGFEFPKADAAQLSRTVKVVPFIVNITPMTVKDVSVMLGIK